MIVASTGDGSYYCVQINDGAESPVTVYQPGYAADQQPREEVAEDFGAFLLSRIQR